MAPLMDESISLHRLTTEILEACLSSAARPTDAEELKAFLNAADCYVVRMQFLGVAAFLQTGRVFHTAGDVEAFVDSGELDMERAIGVMQACTKFFMVGWHARGAVEDTETLKGIVRTQ